VSGTGIVILAALGLRRLFRLAIPDEAIRWLGNFLWILALVYLYFMVVEELTATYAAPSTDRRLAHEVVGGAFAPLFWGVVVSLCLAFALPFLLYVRRVSSPGTVALAALAANVGAVLKRFLLVVPSQTHGALLPVTKARTYLPTWVELGIVAGLCALIALVLLVFGRVFPLVPSPAPQTVEPAARPEPHTARGIVTAVVAALALALIGVGLADSFRLFSRGENDPVLPFSPLLFAGGVMLLFTSAVVYELYGARGRGRSYGSRPWATSMPKNDPGS
jgi:hypothetical protein